MKSDSSEVHELGSRVDSTVGHDDPTNSDNYTPESLLK